MRTLCSRSALVDIFERSQYFGDQLLRHPEMLDEIWIRPPRRRQASIADSASLRAYFRRRMFRIQSDSLLGPAPIFETLERTSDLADAVIAAAYRIALAGSSAVPRIRVMCRRSR